jgi:hypothetical protein
MSGIDDVEEVTISQTINQIVISAVGTQGPPGIFINNIDGGTPSSVYGGNIIIDSGGVIQ